MILVETKNFVTFDQYIKSLTKPAKKNYRYAMKHNENVEYHQFPFEREKIEHWMELWERQLIRGKNVTWAFRADSLEGRDMLCFEAVKNGEIIAVHFIERKDRYLDCHPPIYEKERHAGDYMAKFMWFSLMKWSIENGGHIIDLGGGIDHSWREMIEKRDDYPNGEYKWIFVPQSVKENPSEQKEYSVEHEGISKTIYERI